MKLFQSIKCRGACPCAQVEDPKVEDLKVEDPKVSWGGFGFGGSLLDQTKRMWHGQTSSFSDGKRVKRGLLYPPPRDLKSGGALTTTSALTTTAELATALRRGRHF